MPQIRNKTDQAISLRIGITLAAGQTAEVSDLEAQVLKDHPLLEITDTAPPAPAAPAAPPAPPAAPSAPADTATTSKTKQADQSAAAAPQEDKK